MRLAAISATVGAIVIGTIGSFVVVGCMCVGCVVEQKCMGYLNVVSAKPRVAILALLCIRIILDPYKEHLFCI